MVSEGGKTKKKFVVVGFLVLFLISRALRTPNLQKPLFLQFFQSLVFLRPSLTGFKKWFSWELHKDGPDTTWWFNFKEDFLLDATKRFFILIKGTFYMSFIWIDCAFSSLTTKRPFFSFILGFFINLTLDAFNTPNTITGIHFRSMPGSMKTYFLV